MRRQAYFSIAALVVAILIAFESPARSQLAVSAGQVVSIFTSNGTDRINAGDASNNAVRVNVVAGGAGGGGTSSTYGQTLPTTGTAVGFSDGTNMQTGRVFDLDTGAGAQYGIGVTMRRASSGGSAEMIGQGTMAQSLPVAIASDQSAIPVTVGVVRTIPLHGCAGNTLQDVKQLDVATGAGSAITTADTCVFYVYANNKTANPVTLTIRDRQGTPFEYSTSFAVPANSDVKREFDGHRFILGVTAIAGTAASLNLVLMGVQ